MFSNPFHEFYLDVFLRTESGVSCGMKPGLLTGDVWETVDLGWNTSLKGNEISSENKDGSDTWGGSMCKP